MKKEQARQEDAWADNLYVDLRRFDPPVDLFAVARKREIKQVKLRPMIQRGALLPAPGGFEVILRNQLPKDLDVESPEPINELTTQQRLTLAHEIAHTRFYKTTKGKPVPTGESKEYAYAGDTRLEDICDRVAERLLAPKNLLKKEIELKLNNNYERIDAGFVRTLVAVFRASFYVMIERLRTVDPDNVFTRCIMLIKQGYDGFQVQTWYMGVTLFSALPTPKKYQLVRDWLPELPQAVVEHAGRGLWQFERGGRKFSIQKFTLGKRGNFVLQFDEPARRAPDSGFPWED